MQKARKKNRAEEEKQGVKLLKLEQLDSYIDSPPALDTPVFWKKVGQGPNEGPSVM